MGIPANVEDACNRVRGYVGKGTLECETLKCIQSYLWCMAVSCQVCLSPGVAPLQAEFVDMAIRPAEVEDPCDRVLE